MVNLCELLSYTGQLLVPERFRDYCPNGLQVEGRALVRHLASAVTASREVVERAAADGADALLVHHGWFWRGEEPVVTGMKRARLKALLAGDISLIAYHLPLDAHPQFGNNVGLARALGLTVSGRFGPDEIAWHGELDAPLPAERFAALIAERLGRAPLLLSGTGAPVRRVGWCTGAAQGYIVQAAELGLDAYISGEVSEQTYHAVRELGVHYFAAGHHATERFGVQALGDHLAERFGLVHHFIDVANPV